MLEESGIDSIFLTYEWIISWLEAFGSEGEIMVIKGSGEGWKGIFPLFCRDIPCCLFGHRREISFIGDPSSDQCDFIIVGDKSKAIKSFLQYLRESGLRWDVIRLKEINSDSKVVRELKVQIKEHDYKFRVRSCDVSPYIVLPKSWDTYFHSLSKSFRKKIRKNFRRIRDYGEIELKVLRPGPLLWKTLTDISRKSPKHKQGISLLDQPKCIAFLKLLLPRLDERGWLKVTTLNVSGDPISYDLGFSYRGTIWSYKAAFNADYAEAAPGHNHLALLIEAAIKDKYREFNLLRGGEGYKYNWTEKERVQLEIKIYNHNALSLLLRWKDIFREKIKFLVKKQIRFLGENGLLHNGHEYFQRHIYPRVQRIPVTATVRKGGISLKVFKTLEEIEKLRDIWNPLLDSSRINSIFMTFEWVISWLETFGQEKGIEIIVLGAYKNDGLIGLCPLIIRKSKFILWYVKTVEFAGSPRTDRADLIITTDKEEVIELFWDYLWENRSKWTLVRLREIPTSSLNLSVLGDLFKARGIKHYFRTCSWAPFISLNTSWQDYLLSRSKQFRKHIRKDLRRIKSAGEVELQLVSPTSETLDLIEQIFRNSTKDARGIGVLSQSNGSEFIKKVIRRFESAGWLNLKFLIFRGIPIAYKLNFKYQNKLWLYDSAFRQDYTKYHPGYVVMAMLIQEGIRQQLDEIDYLRGREHYKFHYTNDVRYHREIGVFNNTLISKVLRLINFFKEVVKRLRGGGDIFLTEDDGEKSDIKTTKTDESRKMERILIVDDDPVILKKLKHIIGGAGYRVSSAINGIEALARVEEELPDLIISDIMMPEMDGYEFCRQIRSQPSTSLLPFIFLTARDKIDDRIEGIKLGADAYLAKVFQPAELLAMVRTALLRHQLYLEQARMDILTGLPNRKGIMDELTDQIALARQYQRPISLALIDLDNFKAVNDRYGHPAGDRVLRQFSELFAHEVREQDKIGRWGGEEFLILFAETRELEAAELMERIREKAAGFEFEWEGELIFDLITLSAGVTELLPSDEQVDQIIERADQALYLAKARGKNQVVISQGPSG